MFEVISNQQLATGIFELTIKTPQLARHHQAGQFCIIRASGHSERLPLSIADKDPQAGTISVVVQVAGHSTQEMAAFAAGDYLLDVVGPLGQPTQIGNPHRAAFVGGGVGAAAGHLIVQELKEAGAEVVSVIGFRNHELLIYDTKLARISDELIITTDDGSYGHHGLVTEPLGERLANGENFDLIMVVGPVVMMAAVAEVTRPYGIKTIASLNPIMVDGTGMCGACRVTVGGQTRFACVDGPEFDAHQVDFRELSERLKMYQTGETQAYEAGPHQCKVEPRYWQARENDG